MSRNVYYGNHGEYGPYTSQEYGLPDAGEVLEDFRCVKLMSVQDFTEFGWGVARAYYARGYVKLVSGLYQKEHDTNLFTLNRTQIQDAITDFEEAEKKAAPGLKGNLHSELARAQGLGRRSNTDITLAQRTIEKAKNWIGVVSAEEPYTQNLRDGTVGGLTKGLHMLRTAVVLDAVGRSEEAVQTLQSLESLKAGHIPSDYTRENAWMNIVWSQAAFNAKDFYTATFKAKIALFSCQDIQSAANMIIIQNIYQQLLVTAYKNQQEVKELGRLLTIQKQRTLSVEMQ